MFNVRVRLADSVRVIAVDAGTPVEAEELVADELAAQGKFGVVIRVDVAV